MDELRYQSLQEKQSLDWEHACASCGACCGLAENDPCEELVCLPSGKYVCRIYENRFGLHKTINGRVFKCVPLRKIIHGFWPGDEQCSYKRILKGKEVA